MSSNDSAQDRNLPASARKLRKAREEGQVARSRDLTHFAVIGAGGALLVAAGPWALNLLQGTLASGLRFDARSVAAPQAMLERLSMLLLPALAAVAVLGLLVSLASALSSVASGGWVWSWQALGLKFDRMNPITGLPRIFSRQQLTETLKACVLALILGGIGAIYLYHHLGAFTESQALPLPAAIADASHEVLGGLLLLMLALALFAAVDVPLQRFMHARELRMSLQEVKQEYKEVEGSPEIKRRLRSRMREMATRRQLAAVPKADLVVMNPTHYAVALRYDENSMNAPRVVAKGADLLAMRIRDIAKDAKVPVLQAAPLARALYAHAEVDRDIPMALYSAVAQVLAYVYQLRAAMAGRVAMPADLPPIDVPAELDPHNTPPEA